MKKPDFTKGDKRPAGANQDFTLGATGARGWMYSKDLETTDARQILVVAVAKGSPAGKGELLKKGDVLLGAGGSEFRKDPRTELGNALTQAETEEGGGKLELIRWRKGETEKVTLELEVMGTYSATAPYDCPKSRKILEEGCEALAERMENGTRGQNPIPRCMNALALLASGERKYLKLVKREAEWAADFSSDTMQTWFYGYAMMLVSEYSIATVDKSVLPGLKRLALEASRGQSIVGSWGHRFAGEDGRLLGYGMMNSPGIPLTISLAMAREAGVREKEVDEAIERSAKLIRFYIGKGALPYGDHEPWTKTHEDNGKSGMAGVLFSLLGEPEGGEFFSRMATSSHGAERDRGHTGNYFNMLWAMPAINLSGREATGAWMTEFGGRYYDLARAYDFSFPHQGPPQKTTDKTANFDATGGFLLAYAMPLKKILLTGKKPTEVPQLNKEEAEKLVMQGRGWSNRWNSEAYNRMPGDELLELLGSWSPVIRERAAGAIKHSGEAPIRELVRLLKSSDLNSRYGACETLRRFGGQAAPAYSTLVRYLKNDDLWLRIVAAEALAGMGKTGMEALPELMEMVAQGPTEKDPRNMQQRYLNTVVFRKMLPRGLADVDEDLLKEALAAGLQNQDGSSRGEIGSIYDKLSYKEIEPLLPAIYKATKEPAPSGIMFVSKVRIAGIKILAKHRIEEGMKLCITVMDIRKWGKGARVPQCLKVLRTYGGSAKPLMPELREVEKYFISENKNGSFDRILKELREVMKHIETSPDLKDMRSLDL